MALKRLFHEQNCLSPHNVMIATDYIMIAHANILTISSVWNPSSQNVMEQFNPGLRNLINLGKSYEKAVSGKPHLFISLL